MSEKTQTVPPKENPPTTKGKVAAWCFWDAGGAAMNAVATTFVFSVYLTAGGFGDKDYSTSVVSHALTVAGFVIALTAPITGQRADRKGKGTFWLGVFSMVVVASLAAMFFVTPKPSLLLFGAVLLAIGTIFFEFAAVNYYAMLPRVSTPKNIGRVSGLGWASGYFGGIILLMGLNFLIIMDGNLLGIPDTNAFNIRLAMLISAVWSLLFFLPVLFAVPGRKVPGADQLPRESIVQSYKNLWQTVRTLAAKAPHTLYFMFASAVFRDGLAGVFTFGGIIAVGTFGFSAGEVILFGVAANVISGIATAAIGYLDDKIGPKRVMEISLIALVATCIAVFFLHTGGKSVFWGLGLFLCIWVGPAQSASRSFLARRIPEGNEGEVFGLYQTTGRAVSFLAPALFGAFIWLGKFFVAPGASAQYWGILGIALVLGLGLAMLLPVRENEAHLHHIAH